MSTRVLLKCWVNYWRRRKLWVSGLNYNLKVWENQNNSTIVARGGETSMNPLLLLFGSRIQLWIVWREIPASAAISAIGRPLVRVRSIIACRSCSVCRGLLILPLPSSWRRKRTRLIRRLLGRRRVDGYVQPASEYVVLY
jgi:hypothetical protein